MDLAVLADPRIKLTESEKRDKRTERELKKLWKKIVMVIPVVIGALGSVTE